jgi:sulfite dehydrogenase
MKEKNKYAGDSLVVPDSTRRNFLRATTALSAMALFGRYRSSFAAGSVQLPFDHGNRPLIAYPQKRQLMVLTSRPVQLETPFELFDKKVFTPNDEFFVRWHLADVPTSINTDKFRLAVRGRVKNPLSLSLDDLKKKFKAVEIAAVCQCSGNSRGLFKPRVAGGEWGNGAMGNAKWKGVRLRDILNKAGVQKDAVQARFDGLDGPVLPKTPDFVKALDIDHALMEDVMVAYEMNGKPLPVLNGFPLRLVVPGWYATYWVKMLHDIEVINHVDETFWMKPAYRIPDNPCGCVEPGHKPAKTVPINRMTVRSFITNVKDGASMKVGARHEVRGIAFDGGYGVKRVLVSFNGGKEWREANLGKDHGKYSFREWSVSFKPGKKGSYQLMAMAVNQNGESQRITPRWNPSGYMRNVMEPINVKVV